MLRVGGGGGRRRCDVYVRGVCVVDVFCVCVGCCFSFFVLFVCVCVFGGGGGGEEGCLVF